MLVKRDPAWDSIYKFKVVKLENLSKSKPALGYRGTMRQNAGVPRASSKSPATRIRHFEYTVCRNFCLTICFIRSCSEERKNKSPQRHNMKYYALTLNTATTAAANVIAPSRLHGWLEWVSWYWQKGRPNDLLIPWLTSDLLWWWLVMVFH